MKASLDCRVRVFLLWLDTVKGFAVIHFSCFPCLLMVPLVLLELLLSLSFSPSCSCRSLFCLCLCWWRWHWPISCSGSLSRFQLENLFATFNQCSTWTQNARLLSYTCGSLSRITNNSALLTSVFLPALYCLILNHRGNPVNYSTSYLQDTLSPYLLTLLTCPESWELELSFEDERSVPAQRHSPRRASACTALKKRRSLPCLETYLKNRLTWMLFQFFNPAKILTWKLFLGSCRNTDLWHPLLLLLLETLSLKLLNFLTLSCIFVLQGNLDTFCCFVLLSWPVHPFF